jgi:hypothetical protein
MRWIENHLRTIQFLARMKSVKKLISLTVMLFLIAAPIVRAFAAAPISTNEIRLAAHHDDLSIQLVPRARRPKQSFVIVAPSSAPPVPPSAAPSGPAPDREPLPSLLSYAGLPDHPPA